MALWLCEPPLTRNVNSSPDLVTPQTPIYSLSRPIQTLLFKEAGIYRTLYLLYVWNLIRVMWLWNLIDKQVYLTWTVTQWKNVIRKLMCEIKAPTCSQSSSCEVELCGFQWSLRKAHPCLLVVTEIVCNPSIKLHLNTRCVHLHVGVLLPRTCPSCPCASCNLLETRKAPSDSLLLGLLDISEWDRVFISSSESVRLHVCMLVYVWWVCNLSDTSHPRGRDTPGDDR